MVDGVHRGHHGQQHLRRADVARRLLAADVLLARLQREAQRRVPLRVVGDADDPAGDLALELVARRHVAGVRAAVAERHAEALAGADGDVGADLARRLEQRQRQQVGGDDDGALRRVGLGDERRVVHHLAAGRGVLDEGAERRAREVPRLVVPDDDLDLQRQGARLDDGDRLRVAALGDEEDGGAVLVGPGAAAEGHRLGGGGPFVEHRGVGDRQAGEVGDHRLEVEQRLEPALRDLRLIRRVLRVPAGVLEHVADDRRRGDAVAVARADERAPDLVPRGELAQARDGGGLRQRRGERERRGGADPLGDRLGDQLVQGGDAEVGQHRGDVRVARADVAVGEVVGMVQEVLVARRHGKTSHGASGGRPRGIRPRFDGDWSEERGRLRSRGRLG